MTIIKVLTCGLVGGDRGQKDTSSSQRASGGTEKAAVGPEVGVGNDGSRMEISPSVDPARPSLGPESRQLMAPDRQRLWLRSSAEAASFQDLGVEMYRDPEEESFGGLSAVSPLSRAAPRGGSGLPYRLYGRETTLVGGHTDTLVRGPGDERRRDDVSGSPLSQPPVVSRPLRAPSRASMLAHPLSKVASDASFISAAFTSADPAPRTPRDEYAELVFSEDGNSVSGRGPSAGSFLTSSPADGETTPPINHQHYHHHNVGRSGFRTSLSVMRKSSLAQVSSAAFSEVSAISSSPSQLRLAANGASPSRFSSQVPSLADDDSIAKSTSTAYQALMDDNGTVIDLPHNSGVGTYVMDDISDSMDSSSEEEGVVASPKLNPSLYHPWYPVKESTTLTYYDGGGESLRDTASVMQEACEGEQPSSTASSVFSSSSGNPGGLGSSMGRAKGESSSILLSSVGDVTSRSAVSPAVVYRDASESVELISRSVAPFTTQAQPQDHHYHGYSGQGPPQPRTPPHMETRPQGVFSPVRGPMGRSIGGGGMVHDSSNGTLGTVSTASGSQADFGDHAASILQQPSQHSISRSPSPNPNMMYGYQQRSYSHSPSPMAAGGSFLFNPQQKPLLPGESADLERSTQSHESTNHGLVMNPQLVQQTLPVRRVSTGSTNHHIQYSGFSGPPPLQAPQQHRPSSGSSLSRATLSLTALERHGGDHGTGGGLGLHLGVVNNSHHGGPGALRPPRLHHPLTLSSSSGQTPLSQYRSVGDATAAMAASQGELHAYQQGLTMGLLAVTSGSVTASPVVAMRGGSTSNLPADGCHLGDSVMSSRNSGRAFGGYHGRSSPSPPPGPSSPPSARGLQPPRTKSPSMQGDLGARGMVGGGVVVSPLQLNQIGGTAASAALGSRRYSARAAGSGGLGSGRVYQPHGLSSRHAGSASPGMGMTGVAGELMLSGRRSSRSSRVAIALASSPVTSSIVGNSPPPSMPHMAAPLPVPSPSYRI